MGNITIKKAKLSKDLFLDVEYEEDLKDSTDTVTKKCTAVVHDDLRHAFNRLNEPLAELCEQMDKEGAYDITNVFAKGFSIGGSGDSEGVTISGSRVLSTGKKININTPFTRWDDEDYGSISELGEIIEACKAEVKLYLFEGKHQPDNQLSLFSEESFTIDLLNDNDPLSA